MSLQIAITGVAADWKLPGGYAEILYGQGPATAAAGARSVAFVMPMTSAGTWTANTMYPVRNEAEAELGAGPGSPLHRAVRKFLQHNKNAKLWAVPYAASSGGTPVTATAVLTIATTAAGNGVLEVDVCGETCTVSISTGDTATVIGDAVAASINAKTHLPCTAGNSTGTVTLTAKIVGASQGTATLGVIRVRVRSLTPGIDTTASFGGAFLGTGAAGADGTTTEAANFATALATLDAVRRYYLVTSLIDATSLGSLKTHVVNKSVPRKGLRSVGIGAYMGTLANAQTLAIALNYERLRIAFQPNSELDACSLAAGLAAVLQQGEGVDSSYNFDGYDTSDIIPPAYSAGDWPDPDDQNDAINDGLTIIASRDGGSYIAMSVSTRSKDSTGAIQDFRATESHRVSVTDEFTDEELIEFGLTFKGKKIADDQKLPDNVTVNPNQKQIRNVVRPSGFKGHLLQRLDRFVEAGKLQEPEASKASLRVVKQPGRFEVGMDLRVIDHLHQATFRFAETSVA